MRTAKSSIESTKESFIGWGSDYKYMLALAMTRSDRARAALHHFKHFRTCPLEVLFKFKRVIAAFQQATFRNTRVDIGVCLHQVHKDSAIYVSTVDLLRVIDAHGAHQFHKTLDSIFMECGHTLSFVGDHKTFHEVWILGGHTCWAGIAITLECLDQTKGHHH